MYYILDRTIISTMFYVQVAQGMSSLYCSKCNALFVFLSINLSESSRTAVSWVSYIYDEAILFTIEKVSRFLFYSQLSGQCVDRNAQSHMTTHEKKKKRKVD